MRAWEFEVDVSTHDRLRAHVLVADTRRVTVIEASYVKAALLACQLAAVNPGVDVMPVDVRYLGEDELDE